MHRVQFGLFILPLLVGPPCAAISAAGELSFTDITRKAGTGGPTERGKTGGHGVMFADVDSDGLPDLYITMIFDDPMPELFYRNLGGGRFQEEAARRGIDDFDGGSHGACFADLDNNGHYDLVNGATWHSPQHPAINRVYRNDGRGMFTDVTAASGIPPDRTWPTRAVLAFDMDGDGRLDLFCVTNYLGSDDPPGERNEVYRNLGELRFSPVEAGDLVTAPCGQGATDADFDGDGHIDVIAANRTGDVNILRNGGRGRFTRVDPASIGIRHRAADGITMADVNNDGHLDMLLASGNVGHLYMNSGGGTFTFVQDFSETRGYMGGFADLNNNGHLDLVFAGDGKVYMNDGTGRFTPGASVPVDGINDPRAIAFADIDGDGDLDFAIGCKRSRNWLVRNDLNGGGHWLKVRLVSPQGQAGAFG
ncbi:MAG: VCBS repeat-containing protein, partial [Pirellulales bacterium]